MKMVLTTTWVMTLVTAGWQEQTGSNRVCIVYQNNIHSNNHTRDQSKH